MTPVHVGACTAPQDKVTGKYFYVNKASGDKVWRKPADYTEYGCNTPLIMRCFTEDICTV